MRKFSSFLLFLLFFMHLTGDVAFSFQCEDLTDLSLEELMDLEITSVSKKTERLGNAAAAVFVISQQDIHRSGASNIPEILRMVPGIQVAQIDASTWAISARGFNGRFANKLLVLIDGRTVYTPSYSGVYWDMQDTLLADVERIEVIRGPGASLWGANAVNGVINIITRNAQDTQGGLVTVALGSEYKGLHSVRYGGEISDTAAYRVYGKFTDHDHSVDSNGGSTIDDWQDKRGGFRIDLSPSSKRDLTLQGDIFSGESGHRLHLSTGTMAAPYMDFVDGYNNSSGGNILARLAISNNSGSEMIIKAYYDHFVHDENTYEETRDTLDFDFQHRFVLGKRNEITWGMGYRFSKDDLSSSNYFTFSPNSSEQKLFSTFLQDVITLKPDEFALILGSKLEHNDYTDFEFQPSARFLWTPDSNQTLWASISRAVRTPSRVERDGQIHSLVLSPVPPSPLPVFVQVNGSDEFDAEKVIAYEIGYRQGFQNHLTVDVAFFVNNYSDLRTGEPMAPSLVPGLLPYILQPYVSQNKMSGESYGGEITIDWHINEMWQLKASYSYLDIQLHRDADSKDIFTELDEDKSPENQISILSSLNLPYNVTLDLWGRFVDSLAALNIDSYTTLDARLAWKPLVNIEVAFVGQNLLEAHHQEFEGELFIEPPVEIERSVYGKVTWLF